MGSCISKVKLKKKLKSGTPYCAIARLVMCTWDRLWREKMEMNKIEIEAYMRYMDDGRMFLFALKNGWRWRMGELQFSQRWRMEDMELTGVEITRRALEGSMQEVMKSLNFTTEVEEGDDQWLPTLDVKIRIEESNRISYQHYEKPTTTNTMVQKRSSLEEYSKV